MNVWQLAERNLRELLRGRDTVVARLLAAYVRQGWRLAWAYGDSSTDFEAYAQAGVPKERVYALKRRGDDQCQPGAWQACLDGWEPHLAAIDALPAP